MKTANKIAPVHQKVGQGKYKHLDYEIIKKVFKETKFDRKRKRLINKNKVQWVPYRILSNGKASLDNNIESESTLLSVVSHINIEKGFSPKVRLRSRKSIILPKAVKNRMAG